MLALAALMLSYDGRGIVQTSFIEGARTRSYFGIYEVRERRYEAAPRPRPHPRHHPARHPVLVPGREREPTSYYAPHSGVGLALANANGLFPGSPARIGVVGLGSGTLACYARPGQAWTFFEIDPAMVEVARHRFTFLGSCAPQARIVLGDARLSMARQPAGSIDILAVDAFSSDAVPMHLLTSEALDVYRQGAPARRHRPLPHLQPLSRPAAGDRRSRRARRLDGGDDGIFARMTRKRRPTPPSRSGSPCRARPRRSGG